MDVTQCAKTVLFCLIAQPTWRVFLSVSVEWSSDRSYTKLLPSGWVISPLQVRLIHSVRLPKQWHHFTCILLFGERSDRTHWLYPGHKSRYLFLNLQEFSTLTSYIGKRPQHLTLKFNNWFVLLADQSISFSSTFCTLFGFNGFLWFWTWWSLCSRHRKQWVLEQEWQLSIN